MVNEYFVESVHISLQSPACYLLSRNEMKCGMQLMRARFHAAFVIPPVHHLPQLRRALCVCLFVVLISEEMIGNMCDIK